MTKKQLIAIITAMEDSSRFLANSEEVSETVRRLEKGQASAFATVISMLENPKYAREIAKIYNVEI